MEQNGEVAVNIVCTHIAMGWRQRWTLCQWCHKRQFHCKSQPEIEAPAWALSIFRAANPMPIRISAGHCSANWWFGHFVHLPTMISRVAVFFDRLNHCTPLEFYTKSWTRTKCTDVWWGKWRQSKIQCRTHTDMHRSMWYDWIRIVQNRWLKSLNRWAEWI